MNRLPNPSRAPRRALALACVCALALAACTERTPEPAATGAAPGSASVAPVGICDDERVAWLFDAGGKREPFLLDTTQAVAALVAQLGAATRQEALLRAQEEIVRLGDAALPELARFLELHLKDTNASPRVLNALAVAGQIDSPRARPLLLRGLEHPAESVRAAALRGLARHALPEDFDRLLALVPLTTPETQQQLAEALLAADRTRAEHQLCAWIEAGEYRTTWLTFAVRCADTQDAETLRRMEALLPAVQHELPHYFRAALARNGSAAALEALRARLGAGTANERQVVLAALARAGLHTEIERALTAEPDPKLRLAALSHLADAPAPARWSTRFQLGLGDASPEVRRAALVALCKLGDPAARDQALELLAGERPELEVALAALREPWRADDALAQRALAVLLELLRGERPARVDRRTLERALALVPRREAAAELYAAAPAGPSASSAPGTHRWYALQIGNIGAEGARFLRERWLEESDPVRRLDLLAGSIFEHDEPTRAALISALEDARLVPCERLWIAEQLAQRGHAERIAPLLKRVTLATSDPAVRPALNSLLWRWYGAGA